MHRLSAVEGADPVVAVRSDHAGWVDVDGGVESHALQPHVTLGADARVLHRHLELWVTSDLPRHGRLGDGEI